MAKPKPRLDDFTAQHALEPQPVLSELAPVNERASRPHVSVYIDKTVQKAIKQIALEYDRRPHDLYLEGLDLMLKQYGRPTVEELTRSGK